LDCIHADRPFSRRDLDRMRRLNSTTTDPRPHRLGRVSVVSKPGQAPPPGFDDLSVDEQIEYLQTLWERIAADPDRLPVPEWHRRLLQERIDSHRESPGKSSSWEEVRERVAGRLREPDA